MQIRVKNKLHILFRLGRLLRERKPQKLRQSIWNPHQKYDAVCDVIGEIKNAEKDFGFVITSSVDRLKRSYDKRNTKEESEFFVTSEINHRLL